MSKKLKHFSSFVRKFKHVSHIAGKIEILFGFFCRKNEYFLAFCLKKRSTVRICRKKVKHFSHTLEKIETLFTFFLKKLKPFSYFVEKVEQILRFLEKIERLSASCQNKLLQFFLHIYLLIFMKFLVKIYSFRKIIFSCVLIRNNRKPIY